MMPDAAARLFATPDRLRPGSAARPKIARRLTGPVVGPLLATFLLLGGFLGGVYLIPGGKQSTEQTLVELYLTDLPADFSRVDVWIESASVGAGRTPLTLETPGLDLLAHRGPEQAQRVAFGYVPANSDDAIRLTFQSARAELDHKWIPLEIPNPVLLVEHEFGLDGSSARSILFDINLDESIWITGSRMQFAPTVASVFIHAPSQPSAAATIDQEPSYSEDPKSNNSSIRKESASPFVNEKPEAPKRQVLQPSHSDPSPRPNQGPASTSPRPAPSEPAMKDDDLNAAREDSSDDGGTRSDQEAPASDPDTEESPAEDETAQDETDASGLLPSQEGANSVPTDYAQHVAGWLVQFVPDVSSPEAMTEEVEATGAEIVHRFESVPAIYILANSSQAQQIAQLGNVSYLEPDLGIDYLMASSTTAIHLPDLMASALRDPNGSPFDGRGVGVAVVDTGIDGMHPDLPHRLLEGDTAVVRANWKVESIALVDEPYTDTTSGHGTHVAGIIGGQGTKDSNQRGVAPGAKLYGFGTGEVTSLFWTSQALDWIVQHHDDPTTNPPIRVVTNSWGTQGPYDANSLTTQLVKKLVAEGIVVVFSAGNDGGSGSADMTTAQCKIPFAGVICVAAYNDGNVGTRDGTTSSYSSRGNANQPSTWPDVSAPGSFIRSTRSPFGWVSGVGLLDYYLVMNGTSMAAPHVAGAAALMIQAHPSITPAAVESILKSSAFEFVKGGAYDSSGGHHAKGHGLLDIEAAVNAARNL